MKKTICWIFILLFLIACEKQEKNIMDFYIEEQKAEEQKLEDEKIDNNIIPKMKVSEDGFVKIIDLQEGKVNFLYDEINKKGYMSYNDNNYSWIDGVNVLEVNGYYFPINKKGEAKEVSIRKDELERLLLVKTNKRKEESITKEEIERKLENANPPIKHGHISKLEVQLPGASRNYRNGMHEGIDWYSGATGVEITMKTDVYPIYEGKIVRIDHNYVEMTEIERNELLKIAQKEKKTPEYILDKMRGRQLWIQTDNGVLVRYAHLSSVNEKLKIGQYVKTTMPIAKAGNSGTSSGVADSELDIHPHTDILVYGKLYYEYYEDMDEAINLLYKIFN